MTEVRDTSAQAEHIIDKHVLAAAGTGMVPVPLLDTAALTGVQLKMLRALTRLYGLEFSVPVAKTLLATLASASLRVTLGSSLLSFSKVIPGLGQVAGGAGLSLLGAASTYATGKAFVHHFEQGGSLQNFNAKAMRHYYQQQLEKGKAIARKKISTTSKTNLSL